MKKSYMSNVTCKFLLSFAFLIASVFSAKAQIDITIGSGTGTNSGTGYPAPLQDYYEGSRMQFLYRASELQAAGMQAGNINSIKFNVTALNGFNGVIEGYTIKIGTTSATTLDLTSWEPVSTTVYGPVDYAVTTAVNTFNFAAPFFWDGTSNIVIETCNGSATPQYTENPSVALTTGLGFNAAHTYRADGMGSLCSSTTATNSGTATSRPNITMNWQPAQACAGTPTPGNIATTAGSLCFGQNFTMTATGASVATGLTYQWQSSPDNINWNDIAGANTVSYTTTQTVTTYYRFKVSCNVGGIAYSNVLTVTSNPLVSGTFTINKNGAAAPPNFLSFNAAYDYIKCGINGPVVFNVVPGSGPYNEQLIMTRVPGADATNTVTFNGNGQTLSYSATNANQRAVIKLDSSNYIRFDSLVIDASAGTYGYGVQLIRNSDSNIVRRCTILTSTTATTQNYAGIVINATDAGPIATGRTLCDYNLFEKNKIVGGYYGVTLVGATGGANGYNKFVNNTVQDFYNYGFYVNNSYNTVIEANTITRPSRTGVTDFQGIYFTDLSTLSLIARNKICNPFGAATSSTAAFYGINFNNVPTPGTYEHNIQNNVISSSNGNGIAHGISNTSSGNVLYYHNTISLDSTTATATGVSRGFSQTGQADGIFFYDNIVSITRGGTGAKHLLYFGNSASTIFSDYNDLYINATGSQNYIGFRGSNYATLAAWRSATGQDLTSITYDPLFVSAATCNYRPQNAALDNRGVYLGIDIDIDSTIRDQATPDMGAYEFVPPPCANPVAGTTVLNYNTLVDTTVCFRTIIALGLRNNSFGGGQTFQWQTAPASNGPWTSQATPMSTPDSIITAQTTYYWRAEVKCGTTSVYSNPVKLNVTPALPAGVYTIGGPTHTYNPGVAGGNFINFNDAKAAMSCGIDGLGPVVFNVINGPFNEQLRLDSIAGTSPSSTITFNGNGKTIAYSSSTNNEKAVIKLAGADYINIYNLVVDATGAGTQGVGIQLVGNADSNMIRRCTILASTTATTNSYAGIVINGSESGVTNTGNSLCDYNILDSNTVTGGYYGIVSMASTTSIINNNSITNNLVQDFYNYGIYVGAGNSNLLVEGNRVTRPSRTTSASTVYGINVTGTNSIGISVSKNRIYNLFGGAPTSTNTTYGINHTGAAATTGNYHSVTNNVLYNFTGAGAVYGIANQGSDNVKYYHNTVAIENNGQNPTGLSRGFYQTTVATGIIFENNLISITRDGTGPKHAIYLNNFSTTGTGSDVQSDYNDFYVNAAGSQNYIGYAGSNRLTLGDWKFNTNLDQNSVSIEPGFVNPAAGDYTPSVAPLDNKGTYIAEVPDDILGTLRNTSTPDIGAYEFTVPPCTAPTSTTATVTPNSGLCVDVPITLDIPGTASATGLRYIWQNAASATGPWTNITDSLFFAKTTVGAQPDPYYRAQIICNGTIYYSSVVMVNMNTILLQGTYTIGGPAGPTNFPNFNAAVAALQCGFKGHIIFDVVPGTYTEQVRIGKLPGSSPINRVTFESQNGNAASAILTYNISAATSNYVLKLDSTNYVSFRNLTFTSTTSSTPATLARVIDVSGTAANDTIYGCTINAPVTTNTTNSTAAVYINQFVGNNVLVRNNNVNNGSYGIFFTGTNAGTLARPSIIDSNTVSGANSYGIYTNFTNRLRVLRNTVNVTSSPSTSVYGIYLSKSDTAYRVLDNNVNIRGASSTSTYGLYVNNSFSPAGDSGIVANNKVIAGLGNTGKVLGLNLFGVDGANVVNNVVAIASSGNGSYGLQSNNSNNINYFNNSVNNAVPTDTSSYAAYFSHNASSTAVQVRNNIFSNKGAGKALYVNALGLFTGDYNNLYAASGTRLVRSGSVNYNTLRSWNTASNWDNNSIVIAPSFVSDTTLQPNLNVSDVWAIHGRGIQIQGNSYDINYQPRPQTLTSGVPDLGAYEFFPSVQPTLLPPVSVGPYQAYLFGTDTVMKIKWRGAAPANPGVRRYSGVRPVGLPANMDSMYFYTQVETGGTYAADSVQLFYIDPWQGSIDDQNRLGLGRTLQSNSWVVEFPSRVDVRRRMINMYSKIDFVDKFTGLINPYAPPIFPDVDSSNRGRRFWCAYPVNELDGDQTMVIYLSATEAANVCVKVNGTNWQRCYSVPANTVTVSDTIPKAGINKAWTNVAGKSDRGISIISDVPIVAYAHTYGNTSSGGTMLLPVGVWGHVYQTLMNEQEWGSDAFSYYYVIADNDNTTVEITSAPGVALQTANPPISAGTPTTITLNRGEFYQVVASSGTEELSGSVIRSVPNSQGKCLPFATFSGSSRTRLPCPGGGGSSGGDFSMAQNFPYLAWGQRYLTAPTSASTSATALTTNLFRVAVRDPSTVVKRNGTPLSPLVQPGNYYEYSSNTSDFIEADKPVMVAQYLTGPCTGEGDPEMMYISPIEQGIKEVGFYRNTKESINENYLTLIVPTTALPSCKIYEGQSTTPVAASTYSVFAHSQNGLQPGMYGVNYSFIVKRWTSAQEQVRVTCDSAFTAITYGLGSFESYGYNAGTLVKNLNTRDKIDVPSADSARNYTCANTPFKLTAYIPFKPEYIKWKWSRVPSVPNNDTTIVAPIPTGSFTAPNGVVYYTYPLDKSYVFTVPGVYGVPIEYRDTLIEGCGHTKEDIIYVQVLAAPRPVFSVTSPVCAGDTTFYAADSLTENGLKIKKWNWAFHDGSSDTTLRPYRIWNVGTYRDTLRTVTLDGCLGDTSREVIVSPPPTVDVINDSIVVCKGSDTTFLILNPDPGTTYNWYDSATGVVPIATGDTLHLTNIQDTATYYVEGIVGRCRSGVRKQVWVFTLPTLAAPAPVPAVGSNSITWTWPAITGAVGYEVSTDSASWTAPSSGSTGLSHTVGSLAPQQQVCLWVRALGNTSCETSSSVRVCGQVGCPTDTVRLDKYADSTCAGDSLRFTVLNPDPTTRYYLLDNSGLAIDSNKTTFAIGSAGTYYVQGLTASGCVITRAQVTAIFLNVLQTPVVTVLNAGSNSITFEWQPVTGATGYEVNEGAGWITPSGPGLQHIVTGLQPLQTITLQVRAIGSLPCQTSAAGSQTGTTVCQGFTIEVERDTVRNCINAADTLRVKNAQSSYAYTWYNSANTQVGIGDNLPITITSPLDSFFVQATVGGCVSARTRVITIGLQQLAAPVVTATGATSSTVTFTWNTIPGATSYEVTIPGTPPVVTTITDTTYTVTGLPPVTSTSISVRAIGLVQCQTSVAGTGTGQTTCAAFAISIDKSIDTTCVGGNITYSITNYNSANTYTVYTVPSGATVPVSGSGQFTVSASVGNTVYKVVAVTGTGCVSDTATVTAVGVGIFPAPVITVTDSTNTSVTFTWNAIPGAAGYTVNIFGRNPRTVTVTPGTQTSIVVSPLQPSDTVSIRVTPFSGRTCQTVDTSSSTIVRGTALPCPIIPKPQITRIDSTSSTLTFYWNAVGAYTQYEISTNNGASYVPANGTNGLSHTVTGLATTQNIGFSVRVRGGNSCPPGIAADTATRAALDQVFIPNTFLPNSGNPANSRLRVWSNVLREAKFMIFNQWGQKVFEALSPADAQKGWDGTFGGKPQPIGVYIFVGRFTLTDGTVRDLKGSINLVR